MDVKILTMLIFFQEHWQLSAANLTCTFLGDNMYNVAGSCSKLLIVKATPVVVDKDIVNQTIPDCQFSSLGLQTNSIKLGFTCSKPARGINFTVSCPDDGAAKCDHYHTRVPSININGTIGVPNNNNNSVAIYVIVLRETYRSWNKIGVIMTGVSIKTNYSAQQCDSNPAKYAQLIRLGIVKMENHEYYKCVIQGILHGQVYELKSTLWANTNYSKTHESIYSGSSKPLKPINVTAERLRTRKYVYGKGAADDLKVQIAYSSSSLQDHVLIGCNSTHQLACGDEYEEYESYPAAIHNYRIHPFPGAIFFLRAISVSNEIQSDVAISNHIIYKPLPPKAVEVAVKRQNLIENVTHVKLTVHLSETSYQNFLEIYVRRLYNDDRTEIVKTTTKPISGKIENSGVAKVSVSFPSVATKSYVVDVQTLSAHCRTNCVNNEDFLLFESSLPVRSENFEIPENEVNEVIEFTTPAVTVNPLMTTTVEFVMTPAKATDPVTEYTGLSTTTKKAEVSYLTILVGVGGGVVVLAFAGTIFFLYQVYNKRSTKERKIERSEQWNQTSSVHQKKISHKSSQMGYRTPPGQPAADKPADNLLAQTVDPELDVKPVKATAKSSLEMLKTMKK